MRIVAAVLICCLTAPAAQAGLFVQMAESDLKTHKETLAESYSVQDGKARNENKQEGARSYTIFKGDALYQIDTQAKTYRVLDKKAVDAMSDKINSAMEQMKARMANMPPQQRAMMEQMLAKQGGTMGAPAKVSYDAVSTGQTMNIGGRSCRVWNETENGKLDEQLCVVPFSELPGSDELIAVMQKMSKLFEGMRQRLGRGMSGGAFESKLAVMHKINGFPISSRDYVGGKLADTTTIVKIWQTQAIPAAQFDIPAGYKRLEMPGPAQTRGPKQDEDD